MLENKDHILSPVTITLIYIVAAALWIVFSDKILMGLFGDVATLTKFQTVKGVFFVMMSGLLIYYLMDIRNKHVMDSKNKLIRESNYLSRITESSPVAILFINTEGRITYLNQPTLEILKQTREETIGTTHEENPWELLNLDGSRISEDERLLKQIIKLNKPIFNRRHLLRLKDGTEKIISINGAPAHDTDGVLEGVIYTVTDLTEMTEAEKIIREQEKRYKSLVNDSPYAIAIAHEGAVTFVNPAACELLEAATPEELIGKRIKDLIHPDSWADVMKREEMLLRGESIQYPIEEKYITLKGRPVLLELYATSFNDNGVEAIQIIATDISERITREKLLQSALNEKNTLLTEMHHRVKNNMAVISGLLQIQAFEAEDENIQEVLMDSVRRIQSIAIIHEQLYRAQDLHSIRFDKHIERIVSLIGADAHESEVEVNYELEPILINVNQAVPLALFLNEAVNNVFRHAFGENGKGAMTIRFSKSDDMVSLSIIDNGKGISDVEKAKQKSSLGMQLLELTTSQLHGTLDIKCEKGTYISLSYSSEKILKGSAASVTV